MWWSEYPLLVWLSIIIVSIVMVFVIIIAVLEWKAKRAGVEAQDEPDGPEEDPIEGCGTCGRMDHPDQRIKRYRVSHPDMLVSMTADLCYSCRRGYQQGGYWMVVQG